MVGVRLEALSLTKHPDRKKTRERGAGKGLGRKNRCDATGDPPTWTFNADDYDERHTTLIAELRRLRTLAAQPTRRSATCTGRTEGDAFQAMAEAEQKAFIRLWTLTVWPKDSGHPNVLVAALHGVPRAPLGPFETAALVSPCRR